MRRKNRKQNQPQSVTKHDNKDIKTKKKNITSDSGTTNVEPMKTNFVGTSNSLTIYLLRKKNKRGSKAIMGQICEAI